MKDRSPSERELEILKVLWELRSATVREVYDRMCPNGELAMNTIQTLLRIMDEKGLVSHRREGRAFVYEPRQSREKIFERFLDKVFDGAMDQLVMTMIRSRTPDKKELKRLQESIDKSRKANQQGE